MATPEIHRISKLYGDGDATTATFGGVDYGHTRGGGGSGGSGDCNCSWSQITGKPNFAAVATTGNYNDLGNKPTIPAPYDDTALAARVTALEQGGGGSGDCNCSWSQITGKPTFAPVATSGSYNDLTNKPTIPAAYNDTELRNKVNANETAIGNLQGVDLSLGNRITALENSTTNLGKVTNEITVSNAVGQATNGKRYAVGTPLETILRDILTGATPVTYTITFNANGGTVSPTSATTGTNGKLSSLPTPTHATDTFKGWFTAAIGGTAVTTNTVFTQNTTIFAQWEEVSNGLPIYGTITDIDTLDEIAVDNTAGEYEFYLAKQFETKPAYFDVPAAWTTTVYVFNALTNQWVVSRDHDPSNVTHTVNGATVNYTRYTDNREMDAGPRRIKINWTV